MLLEEKVLAILQKFTKNEYGMSQIKVIYDMDRILCVWVRLKFTELRWT